MSFSRLHVIVLQSLAKGLVDTGHYLTRYLWGTLLIVAVLTRALIPAGMMPDQSRVFTLTICTDFGTTTIDLPADTYDPTLKDEEQQNDQTGHSKDPCPYATGFTTSILVFAVAVADFIDFIRTLFDQLVDFQLPVKHLFGSASPRAPPSFF